MGVDKANLPAVCNERLCSYQNLSLVDLTWRIVESADRSALSEFHDQRSIFMLRGSSPMLLVRFVEKLCRSAWVQKLAGQNDAVIELACDLTVDKFSHIPDEYQLTKKCRQNGPDCRNYFRAFLRQMTRWSEGHPEVLPLLWELSAARIFQNHVVRNFRYSCLEARRSVNPTRSRYGWRLDGKVLYFWMPVTLPGSHRRGWLEDNVDNPEPCRPGERYRIQSIIDGQFGIARHVSINEARNHFSGESTTETPLELLIEREISTTGLAIAKIIADEKAENIHKQRPAIGALGCSALRQLILNIFEDLSIGCYVEGRLASAFGLSKATFSRFAGSRWQNIEHIPDLWANTAGTLARHKIFREAAYQAGVWEHVKEVLQNGPHPRMGEV